MTEKEIKELKKKAEWKGDVEAAKTLAYMYYNGTNGVEPSMEDAAKWYKKAASKGDAISMGWAGWFYLGNRGHEKDEKKAFAWLKKACEAGDSSSMIFLAKCFRNGTGVKINLKKSIEWLEKGVEGNSSSCMYELALMYMDGRDGVEKNERKAAYYMEMSAQNNVKMGMFYYGNFCMDGVGVEQNSSKALYWWKKSADEGCLDAQFSLGRAYLTWNFSPDPEVHYAEGVSLLEKAYANGNKEAAFELGKFYYFKKKDSQLSIKWCTKTAETGHIKAMAQLGAMNMELQEYTEAAKWLKKAADAGNKLCMRAIGSEYLDGIRIAPDFEKAKYYLEKGYEPNNVDSIRLLCKLYSHEYYEMGKSSEAYEKSLRCLIEGAELGSCELMYNLAVLYQHGDKGENVNLEKAAYWYKEAAQKEHALAMYRLAKIYLDHNENNDENLRKLGCEWMEKAAENDIRAAVIYVGEMYYDICTNNKDAAAGAKAAYWFKIATEKYNHPRSYCNLGLLYVMGYWVDKDPATGVKYTKKAVDLGDDKALYNMGVLYNLGLGVEKNYEEAIKWFKKAIEAKYSEEKATYEIGCAYINIGDKKNAIEWLEKAVAYNVENAKEKLEEVYETMADEKSAMDELDSYIGLNKVKQKMRDFAAAIKMKERRRQMGQDVDDSGFMHMVFTGNAGTGKTEVAKLVARVLCEIGVISNPEPVIAERGDLVAGYIGQTEKKTNEVIEKALGGVLFIDEAYTLSKVGGSGKDFGQEAIDALLTAMVKHRNNLVVIAAGYKDDMERFLASNQGLKSRFGTIIEFEDYTADELYEIFERLCKKQNFTVEEDAVKYVKEYLAKNAGNIEFGNARGVGKYFQDIKDRQGNRLLQLDESVMDEEEIRKAYATFIVEDIKQEEEKKQSEKSAMDELEGYIGLNKVKQKMRDLQISVKMRKRRQDLGMDVVGNGFLHMIFTGNPGTGKTEVAKIVARVLCEIGVLSNPEPVIVERGDLVAEFIGQTEKKTNEVIEKALGGVLFIDEAYTLSKGDGSGKDFGQEAIDTLLTAMVKYKENLVVIAAGYTEDMERFLESNKGLQSRFNEIIEFEDYTADELYAIFTRLLEKRGFIMSNKADELVYKYLERKAGDYNFGNGRGVDRYFTSIMNEQDKRLSRLDETGLDEDEIRRIYRTFTEEDVMAAYA